MGISFLFLVIFQVVSLAAIVTLWVKITKIQNQEDHRLSKGLQLLQGKLAVLEDLSDRTEIQVNQLVSILEGKIKEIQTKLIDADKVIGKIEKNIAKSLEVANIFQDKIPHQEILERQYTKKYVKAAQLAHAGHSVEEISSVVELTRGEVELIVKLNRDQLQFEVTELPEWAKGELVDRSDVSPLRNLETAFEVPKADNQNLKKLGDQFRTAMARPHSQTQSKPPSDFSKRASEINNEILNTFSHFFDSEPASKRQPEEASEEQVIMQGGKKMTVKPFHFKHINNEANI